MDKDEIGEKLEKAYGHSQHMVKSNDNEGRSLTENEVKYHEERQKLCAKTLEKLEDLDKLSHVVGYMQMLETDLDNPYDNKSLRRGVLSDG